MSAYAELAVTTNFSFLRGASHPQEMVAARRRTRPRRHRHRRPQQFCRRGARLRRSAEQKNKTSRRHPPRHDRWFRGARLSDRSRRLWPALPPHHRRQSQGQEGRMPSDLRRHSRRQRRPDADRIPPLDLSPPLIGRTTFTERLAALARAAPGRTFLAGAHYHRGDEPRRLGLLAELGARVRRAARRRQRRPLSRAGAPAARRYRHLHPREMHALSKPACG